MHNDKHVSNANNDTDPPEARCACVCVCVGRGGQIGRQEADRRVASPTAVAIYLCLGPPGRSDTNGIAPTVRQGAEKRERSVKLKGGTVRRRRRRDSEERKFIHKESI